MTPIKPYRIRDQVYRRTGRSLLKKFLLFQHLFIISVYISVVPTFSPPSYHIVDTNTTLVGLRPHVWHKLTNGSRHLLNISFILCEAIELDDTTLESRRPPWTTTYFRCDSFISNIRIKAKIEGENEVLVSHLLIK